MTMYKGMTGKVYQEGDVIVRQGEVGDCMYMISSGKAEVLVKKGSKQVRLAVLGPRDFFGEMAIFDREKRSATVRAMGELRVIAIDKENFEKRIVQMPWLAFSLLERMSHRIREADRELVKAKKVAKQPARAKKTKA
jgi:CRP/FNR family cyclic AMP-dependent transcriptional regulator